MGSDIHSRIYYGERTMAQSPSNLWPIVIDDVIDYLEMSSPHPEPTVQLVFRDDAGWQVSLQLRRTAADNLLKKLQAGPTPPA